MYQGAASASLRKTQEGRWIEGFRRSEIRRLAADPGLLRSAGAALSFRFSPAAAAFLVSAGLLSGRVRLALC